ncbi:MAG TPA: prolipoprotein diacylglyceryl transferase [Frankiaceae bacterium]|nr:prolipoprotein diacylglyceryl transferase [Frankiaceae bacterium]
MLIASFPSPSSGVLHLGPLPLRAYAFCIVLGIIAAVVLAEQRLRARGAPEGTATELATWGVPFGLVGARIYHLITTPEPYFGKGGHPLDAFAIWNGGLGIWGGIAAGFLGGVIAVRRMGLSVWVCADAVAPALAVAQAIGRWGNYFNQELYGRATNLPWAVRIDPEHRVDPNQATYHPTFLYESLWNLGVAAVCIWADRRYRLGKGRVFALYVALYCLGRAWVEALRVDEAHRFFGLRVNDYVSLALFLAGMAYLVARRGQREPETARAHGDPVPVADSVPAGESASESADESAQDGAPEEAHATGPTGGNTPSSGED